LPFVQPKDFATSICSCRLASKNQAQTQPKKNAEKYSKHKLNPKKLQKKYIQNSPWENENGVVFCVSFPTDKKLWRFPSS
jgi:hypothetical protein